MGNLKRLLVVLQPSNYDTKGIFILEADSTWQMSVNRVREMMKLDPEMQFDIVGPKLDQLRTSPRFINPEIFSSGRVHYVQMKFLPNALATRYDFDLEGCSDALGLPSHKKNQGIHYDAVYLNDPMMLRHYRALFYLKAGYMPKFFVHSHFVDCPGNPKFPKEASLWLGQCEAAITADYNFWQCQSAMNEFFDEMSNLYSNKTVSQVKKKSSPYDDGYSIEEMRTKINVSNVRFSEQEYMKITQGKIVIFAPNRIGGLGRSSDYTQVGKFMFEILPELWKSRTNNGKKECDYVVFAGNPSQKFLNHELEQMCGAYGYVNLVPDSLTRDEYKFIAKSCGENGDIALGLYNADTFGGTASRECIEMGMMPFWCDNYEYTTISKAVLGNTYHTYLCKPDLSDAVVVLNRIMDLNKERRIELSEKFREYVRKQSSFEETTKDAFKIMKNIVRKS